VPESPRRANGSIAANQPLFVGYIVLRSLSSYRRLLHQARSLTVEHVHIRACFVLLMKNSSDPGGGDHHLAADRTTAESHQVRGTPSSITYGRAAYSPASRPCTLELAAGPSNLACSSGDIRACRDRAVSASHG